MGDGVEDMIYRASDWFRWRKERKRRRKRGITIASSKVPGVSTVYRLIGRRRLPTIWRLELLGGSIEEASTDSIQELVERAVAGNRTGTSMSRGSWGYSGGLP